MAVIVFRFIVELKKKQPKIRTLQERERQTRLCHGEMETIRNRCMDGTFELAMRHLFHSLSSVVVVVHKRQLLLESTG